MRLELGGVGAQMPQPGDVDMDGYMILYLDKRMIPFNYYSGTIARERERTLILRSSLRFSSRHSRSGESV
jgi:hypothetical protein